MGLAAGTRLGPYEILAPVGAGGMGEVYRARDTRLGRTVAVKILPGQFSSDPVRRQRFEREAKTISNLNHPHICGLYDVGNQDGMDYLVMECVEGETLSKRLEKGPLPLEQVLKLGAQIAAALDKAHRSGVVHRDVKPGNIMLTPTGAKLLDFGLAKPAAQVSAATLTAAATQPTPVTQVGAVVGTFQYMSPEQIEGKELDGRSDIFSLGAVLYEMLTGQHAFQGKSQLSVASAILEKDPAPIASIRPLTPPALDHVVKKCLAKLPNERWQSASDLASELKWIAEAGSLVGVPAPMPLQRKLRDRLAWALAAAFSLAAITFAISFIRRAPQSFSPIVSEISPPVNAKFVFVGFAAGPPVLSPNGERLAFSAVGLDGRQRLWIRPLNSTAAQALEGTDGATLPFWSPDSRSLGFFANGRLNRTEASGASPLPLCEVSSARGGSWGPDGTILFAPGTSGPIFRIPASGGMPQRVTKLNASLGETSHRWPQFLPDGEHFLFSAGTAEGISGTYAAPLAGGEAKLIVRNDLSAIYTPPGYLLFLRQGTLMAQRFDASKLQIVDDAISLVEQVAGNPTLGGGTFSASENGILVYLMGSAFKGGNELLWLDRNGRQIGKTGSSGEYATTTISPDGSRLASAAMEPTGIWVYDVTRGTRTRLTFDVGLSVDFCGDCVSGQPAWSPDGKFVAFFSEREGQRHIYQKAADGTGTTTPLVVDDATEGYPSFSSDGHYLIFQRQAAQSNSRIEIWTMPLFGERKAVPVVQGQFHAVWPSLSPDGKWLAYASAESGRAEIYVVPFLHGSGKWLISTNGGTRPRWRRDGKELFYLSLDNKMMSARIADTGSSLSFGQIQSLFQANPSSNPGWLYDVSADGKKFLVVSEGNAKSVEPLTLVVNWPELMKKQ